MRYDTIIRGGRVHTGERSFVADVGIRGEKIAAVRKGLRGGVKTREIDARGLDVIPGALDVHVHLALPFCGTVSCDDFESGSRAALAGGVTGVIDFAIPGEGQSLAQAHETWTKKAEGISTVDYAWHMAITKPVHIEEIPACVRSGLPTFKEFMIYESEGWSADDAMLYRTLRAIKNEKSGAMLLVHAESSRVLDSLIAEHHTPELMKKWGARLHPMTRPNFIEAEAIERAIRWSSETGGPLYIVHMSTAQGADLVDAARGRGVPVMAETCAQYLVLDDSVFKGEDGHLFACCPQVKKKPDIERLWKGVRGGGVDVVSTDTCSFTREQKGMWWDKAGGYGDFTKIPMGLPGLETLVPIVYTLGVKKRRITMNRLVELCCTNPAEAMGLAGRKGRLAPGYDADVAILDPASRRVDHARMHSRCDWSPYQGMTLAGFARTTLVRGAVAYDAGEFPLASGHGRFLPRRGPRVR